MLIFERGSQRYIVDPESGKAIKFDPHLHDRADVSGLTPVKTNDAIADPR